jgi:hypothetical protein
VQVTLQKENSDRAAATDMLTSVCSQYVASHDDSIRKFNINSRLQLAPAAGHSQTTCWHYTTASQSIAALNKQSDKSLLKPGSHKAAASPAGLP